MLLIELLFAPFACPGLLESLRPLPDTGTKGVAGGALSFPCGFASCSSRTSAAWPGVVASVDAALWASGLLGFCAWVTDSKPPGGTTRHG